MDSHTVEITQTSEILNFIAGFPDGASVDDVDGLVNPNGEFKRDRTLKLLRDLTDEGKIHRKQGGSRGNRYTVTAAQESEFVVTIHQGLATIETDAATAAKFITFMNNG